jgi:hypothetical protein
MSRQEDIDEFYRTLATLERVVNGPERLGDCDGYMNWPDRGVYFFFSPDRRRDGADRLRLTRVGTHAVGE